MEDTLVEGLDAPVEIFTDALGMPHIYAQTDHDAMYASGYQMATDRLFQLELMRRRAMGTRAAVLGARYYESDRLSRIFDFPRWGAANMDRLRADSPQDYAALQAWVAGVNARIDEVRNGDAPLPYGFGPDELDLLPEPMTMQEHGAVTKLIMFGNSNSLERELLTTILARNFTDVFERLQLARPAFDVSTMPVDELPARLEAGDERGTRLQRAPIDATDEEIRAAVDHLHEVLASFPTTGSNNWAVAGTHTDSGRPMIAGDPHQPLDSPSLMYAQHVNSADAGGTLDAMGWSFVGAGGVHLGRNAKVHWSQTTNFADVMDVWEVPIQGTTLTVAGASVAVQERTEVIEVAGEDPRAETMLDVDGYGVILPNDLLPLPVAGPGNALLLNWTGFRATTEESAFLDINRAQSLEALEAGIDRIQVGGFNFVSADADGISYRVAIDVPDRGDPSARQMPYLVLDGSDAGSYWTDMLPADKLPRSRGASQGWVATANNDPWGFTFDGDVSNDPWYYGYFYAAGHRAQRLQSELTRLVERGDVSLEDMQALQTDVHSNAADAMLPVLDEVWAAAADDEALAAYAADPDVAALIEQLRGWDRAMTRDSSAALVFHVWLLTLTDEVMKDDFSILYQTVLEAESPFIIKIPMLAVQRLYPRADELMQDGRDVAVLRALSRTAELLTQRFGSVDPAGYRWGDAHGTFFDNPFGERLELGFVSTDGGEDTVNVSSSRFLDDNGAPAERFDATSGAIFRVVTTFDEDGTPRSFANFPPGNVESPDDPGFANTLEDWTEGRYAELAFARTDVEEASVAQRVLDPADHGAEN
ncbi:MAG: penicillin acylase family protein [Myxococcota bacterium]